MSNMKRIQNATLASLVVALLGMASQGGALRADTIKLANGQIMTGVEILEATYENVSYKQGVGSAQSLEAGKVIELTRDSGYLNKIRSAFQAGKYREALAQIKNAKGFGAPAEKAEAAYLEGEVFLAAGPKFLDNARKAFGDYLKEYGPKKDFFVPHATFGLGQVSLEQGKASEAKSQFQKLESFGGRDGIWGFKAKIGLARAILGTGQDLLDARRVLLDVVKGRGVPQAIQEEALVLRARVFNLQEQYKQASDLLEKDFFGEPGRTYNEFFAQACIEMGDSFKGRKGKSNLQEAELWYLKATLFGKNYASTMRKAALALAEVYQGLGQSDREAAWKQRAES